MGFLVYNFLANCCIANKGQESDLSTPQETEKKQARKNKDDSAVC